jgi:hypothetical protein
MYTTNFTKNTTCIQNSVHGMRMYDMNLPIHNMHTKQCARDAHARSPRATLRCSCWATRRHAVTQTARALQLLTAATLRLLILLPLILLLRQTTPLTPALRTRSRIGLNVSCVCACVCVDAAASGGDNASDAQNALAGCPEHELFVYVCVEMMLECE